MSGASFAERFWRRVVTSPSGCWEWTGAKDRKGYGRLFTRRPHTVGAHRLAWMLVCGDPGDLFVCHHCDNRVCCNPSHLFVGTNTDNVRDMDQKGRRKTVSLRGPEHGNAVLTPDLVLGLRARKQAGESYTMLAAATGLSRATIASAVSGRTWGWL